MIAQYDGHGLSFVYPENWTLDEACDEWPKEVQIESPGGAFLSLHIYPEDSSAGEVVAEAIKTIREDYEERGLELLPFAGNLLENGPPAEGYDITFSLLDFIVQIQLRCFMHQDQLVLAMCQAEFREFEELQQVFLAILWSMVHVGQPLR